MKERIKSCIFKTFDKNKSPRPLVRAGKIAISTYSAKLHCQKYHDIRTIRKNIIFSRNSSLGFAKKMKNKTIMRKKVVKEAHFLFSFFYFPS